MESFPQDGAVGAPGTALQWRAPVLWDFLGQQGFINLHSKAAVNAQRRLCSYPIPGTIQAVDKMPRDLDC
jgi:hypothetical protein